MLNDKMKQSVVDINEAAFRAHNRRIMEKRVETGCYAEDGLYCRKRIESPLTMVYFFVNNSVLLFRVSEEFVYYGTPTHLNAAANPMMAEAWFQSADGMEELREFMRKEKEGVASESDS